MNGHAIARLRNSNSNWASTTNTKLMTSAEVR